TAGERPPSGSRNHVALNSRGVKYSRVECKRTALWCRLSVEFLGESDEKPFRPADVAEPIRVFILDNFAHELRAALAEPLERLFEVIDDDSYVVHPFKRHVSNLQGDVHSDNGG